MKLTHTVVLGTNSAANIVGSAHKPTNIISEERSQEFPYVHQASQSEASGAKLGSFL